VSTPRELTPRQKDVLRALCRWLDEHGYPPTVRELGGVMGLTSTRTIHDHLDWLERKGYIRRDRVRSRAIEVLHAVPVPDSDGEPFALDQSSSAAGAPGSRPRTVTVPLIGDVAAGRPILAAEQREGELHLDATLVGDPRTYLLRVRGNSMIDAHICNGDLILIRPQPVARNGEIVVVLIEDEVTLKRFYKREGFIELKPENPSLASILVTPEMGEVRVLGALAGVIRRC
jgi:repressor LexA